MTNWLLTLGRYTVTVKKKKKKKKRKKERKKKEQFQLLYSKAGIVPQIHSTSITLWWVQLFHSLSSQCSSQDPYSTVPFIHVSSQCFFLMVFIFYSPFWDHSKLILSFKHTIASSSHHSPLPSCSAHFHIFSLCSLCIALYPSPIPLHSQTSCRQPLPASFPLLLSS